MKCQCEECQGRGTITCPECNGRGELDCSIEIIALKKSMHNYDELLELQRDAMRVIRQAQRLAELNPQRSESYYEQLKGCLFVINSQAEKAAKLK
jgi:RecJ-like exonuclease